MKKLEERSLEKLCTLPIRKKPRTAKSCTSDMLNLFRSEVEGGDGDAGRGDGGCEIGQPLVTVR